MRSEKQETHCDLNNGQFTLKLNLTQLKYIAIICMLIDHIGYMFALSDSNVYIIMRTIGRITAPIMFYASIEGYKYTQSKEKYFKKLLTFAIISQIPFSLAFQTNKLNVMFEILFNLLIINVYESKLLNTTLFTKVVKILTILTLFFVVNMCDYGWLGTFITLSFYVFRDDKRKQLFAYFLIIFFKYWYYPLEHFIYNGDMFISYDYIHFGMLLPMFLLFMYDGTNGNSKMKWLFYIFYPLHLIVLVIIKAVL